MEERSLATITSPPIRGVCGCGCFGNELPRMVGSCMGFSGDRVVAAGSSGVFPDSSVLAELSAKRLLTAALPHPRLDDSHATCVRGAALPLELHLSARCVTSARARRAGRGARL